MTSVERAALTHNHNSSSNSVKATLNYFKKQNIPTY